MAWAGHRPTLRQDPYVARHSSLFNTLRAARKICLSPTERSLDKDERRGRVVTHRRETGLHSVHILKNYCLDDAVIILFALLTFFFVRLFVV